MVQNNLAEGAGPTYGSTLCEIEHAIKLFGIKKMFRDFFSVTGFKFAFPVTVDKTSDPKVYLAKAANAMAYSQNDNELECYGNFINKYQTEFARMNLVICQVAETSMKLLNPENNLPCFARYWSSFIPLSIFLELFRGLIKM